MLVNSELTVLLFKHQSVHTYIHTIASNPDQQDECHVMLAAVLLIAVMCMSSGGDFGSAIHRRGINSN